MRTFLLAPAFIALALLSSPTQANNAETRCRGRWPAAPVPAQFPPPAPAPSTIYQAQLAQKAHQQGAIAWRINAAGGGNKLAGSAIIYK